jgi:hypothetical protein
VNVNVGTSDLHAVACIAMTEAEWLDAFYLPKLIRLLQKDDEPSVRKQMLFSVACCRRTVDHLSDAVFDAAIDVCERQADTSAPDKLPPRLERSLRSHATNHPNDGDDPRFGSWAYMAHAVESLVRSGTGMEFIADCCRDALCGHDDFVAGRGEMLIQADLFRDIFGNPFRPVAFAPEWRSSTAVALAESMYAARNFGNMPVLADALEEAGCDNADVLAHCRGDGPHVRGCWVVDLVSGKS